MSVSQLLLYFELQTNISFSQLVPYIYPTVFILYLVTQLYGTVHDVWSSWAQQIRDAEFLVEMQLENLEIETPGDTSISTVSSDDSLMPMDE